MKSVRKPDWLKVKIPSGDNYRKINAYSRNHKLATVCQESKCPNIGDCWNSGTATFMLMGDTCTRACRFCSVQTSKNPPPLNPDEPADTAKIVAELKLKHVVLTTVDRDDLEDQGANHIAATIQAIKTKSPDISIEVLIPDFQGKGELIEIVVASRPTIIAHNVECVERLSRKVRDPRAGYQQSLDLLQRVKEVGTSIISKSSLMVGFGENFEEVVTTMKDIRNRGTSYLTIGQYLQPDQSKLPVTDYIKPEIFKKFEILGLEMGFQYVASGPLIRSSYHAGLFHSKNLNKLTLNLLSF